MTCWSVAGVGWKVSLAIAVLSGWLSGPGQTWAEVTARIVPEGDAIELEVPTDLGLQKDRLPLYRQAAIRYFSAGIGQVEREAVYPAFSLKLVFTAGGKPFVTGVSLVVRDKKGATVLTVPAEHISGPWLFVDLPEGTYDVAATLGGELQQVKGVKVGHGKVTTQHVRWKEDRSPPLAVSGE
ncbi:MAG: hypothetical protein KF814_07460 [Nitrospiraceae bacterium]|nr:hypothetical protein [Nitrospiraceae bacterium]